MSLYLGEHKVSEVLAKILIDADEYTSGYTAGKEAGIAEGYANGYDEGWIKGYSSGGGDGIIERSVTEITSNAKCVGPYAFYMYQKIESNVPLEKIVLPNATYLDNYAFYKCQALKTVEIPKVGRIDNDAFNGCSSLASIDLKVDRGWTLYSKAFANCSALKTLILRQNARNFELTAIDVFSNTPIAKGAGYVYAPRNRVDMYKNQTNWSVFADQFRVLENYTKDGTITGEFDYSKI